VTCGLAASGTLAVWALGAAVRAHAVSGAASASSWGLILGGAAVWAGWEGWHAWRHPYGPCGWCNGTGKNKGSTRRRYGVCKRCKGTGRRLRTGARLFHKGLDRGRGKGNRP
jgi:hypothetical protein